MKQNYSRVYFVGIGGIGMSAIARYFRHEQYAVAGYDKTSSSITESLGQIGIDLFFDDSVSSIPMQYRDSREVLVVYTPAIPANHPQLNYFLDNGFNVVKRSEILGELSKNKFLMAVAGTHGKTSTSTMLAYFNFIACNGAGSAFLGGISKNINSNLLLGIGDRLTVEADEFDRSFLQLFPNIALITSTDADHLDIYNDHSTLKNAFSDFVSQISPSGTLIYRYGIDLDIKNRDIKIYTYSLSDDSDFRADNISLQPNGTYVFDIICPDRVIKGCNLGVIGLINIENCIGAVAMLWAAGGWDENLLKEALINFRGVKRRLEVHINTPELVYIDDYAHHPQELRATIMSIRDIFPNRKITALFQPHLFSRTRDFAEGFAQSLSLCDEVLLLPIYPAREQPLPGVDSEMICRQIKSKCTVVQYQSIPSELYVENLDVFITFGAGDIDRLCRAIYDKLTLKK